MADFFKGLAGGFGTGLQFGQAMRQRRMEDELAQAYAKPEEFTDYTPEQQRQIRDLQASDAYDVSAVPGAAGAAPTLRYAPRQGLDLQGDMPAAPGAYIDVAPQQVQRYGGQTTAGRFDPTQLRGLQMQEAARVLGSYGDVRGAAQLQAQAEEQAYQAKRRPMELAGLERSAKLGDIQLSEAERKVKQDESNRKAQGMLAERVVAGTPIDTATANKIAQDTGADMAFVTDAVLKQYNLTKEAANDLIQRQLTDFNKAAEGGIPSLNKYIAERLDPDKTDNIVPSVVQGKDGKLRVMYGDQPLPGYQAYGGLDQLSAAFQGNIKRDPLGAAIQISTLDTQEQARKASAASIEASRAQTREAGRTPLEKTVQGLRNLGVKVTPSMIESLGGLDKAESPRLKAQLSIIEKAVAEGTLKPEEGLKRVDTLFADASKAKQSTRDQAEIVSGIKAESKAGKLPALINYLKTERGYTDAALAPLFEEAGIKMPASATPAAAPATTPGAVSPRTGLSTGSQQQQYGPLTPRATIEADARAGVPAAVAYLKQQAAYARDLERVRTENAMRAAQGE